MNELLPGWQETFHDCYIRRGEVLVLRVCKMADQRGYRYEARHLGRTWEAIRPTLHAAMQAAEESAREELTRALAELGVRP